MSSNALLNNVTRLLLFLQYTHWNVYSGEEGEKLKCSRHAAVYVSPKHCDLVSWNVFISTTASVSYSPHTSSALSLSLSVSHSHTPVIVFFLWWTKPWFRQFREMESMEACAKAAFEPGLIRSSLRSLRECLDSAALWLTERNIRQGVEECWMLVILLQNLPEKDAASGGLYVDKMNEWELNFTALKVRYATFVLACKQTKRQSSWYKKQ